MSIKSINNNYLSLLTIFVVFYPTKGLLNFLYFFPAFESYPGLFNKFIFALFIITLLLMLLYNKFNINKYATHIICTLIALVLSISKGDIHLINKVNMLFVFPILLSVLDNVSEIYISKVIRAFFKFILIYMALEFLLLSIKIDSENLISQEIYKIYYSILTPFGSTIDYRHPGSWDTFRSGGFLADAIAMPVLVVMSSLYFYINYRLYNKYLYYTIIGIFLVLSNPSTTGIISFICTIILFEYYHFKLNRIIFLLFIIAIILFMHPTMEYNIIRFTENMSNEKYVSTYFNYGFIYEVRTYIYFIFGNWVWFDKSISSHIDLFLIPKSMGLIGLYIIYKIFIRGFLKYRKSNNIYTIYSYLLISAFICLYHHGMALSVNVIIIVIVMSNRVNNTISPKIRIDLMNMGHRLKYLISSIKYNKFS